MNNKQKKFGFTLIEMLVAVFVFMIVFLIAASFVNLASGQTKSSRTRNLTTNLRHTLDVVNQKMATANGRGVFGVNRMYGFEVDNNNVLGIVNNSGGLITCTFIGKKNNSIFMKVDNCSSWPTIGQLDQPLTDSSVSVTDLIFSGTTEWVPSSGMIPYLKITIIAKDADPKYEEQDQIRLETSYTLDYNTIKELKRLEHVS